MGIALWTVCGAAAAVAAGVVRFGPRRRILEAVAALATALLLGLTATALDFGGWNEPDWRAGVFTFLAALAAAGAVRAIGARPSRPLPPGVPAQRLISRDSFLSKRPGLPSQNQGDSRHRWRRPVHEPPEAPGTAPTDNRP